MRLTGSGLSPQRQRLVKGLSLCCAFTLLSSLAFAAWYNMTSQYSAIIDSDDIELIQLEEPKEGDPIAVMHTNVGNMTYVLYPEECPQAVENFTKLAESGYYNNTCVFRVEQNIFFSGGAPNADGSLNEADADTERIPRELSPKLWPLRGSLCALTTYSDAGFFRVLTGTQRYYNGSRFLVIDSIEMTDEIKEGLQSDGNEAMQLIANALIENGGIPNYAQQITIFGQLIDGFDVLTTITGAELTGEENAMHPVNEITILSVEITEFS